MKFQKIKTSPLVITDGLEGPVLDLLIRFRLGVVQQICFREILI